MPVSNRVTLLHNRKGILFEMFCYAFTIFRRCRIFGRLYWSVVFGESACWKVWRNLSLTHLAVDLRALGETCSSVSDDMVLPHHVITFFPISPCVHPMSSYQLYCLRWVSGLRSINPDVALRLLVQSVPNSHSQNLSGFSLRPSKYGIN